MTERAGRCGFARAGFDTESLKKAWARALRLDERSKAERLAERLGVGLGQRRADGRFYVNGHHGQTYQPPYTGCGTYELVLNIEEERVDCANCGASDLAPRVRRG